MGIDFTTLHLFSRALSDTGNLSGKRLLTLGVQDCHFTYDELLKFLRRHNVPHVNLARSEVELTTGFRWVDAAEAAKYRMNVHQRTLFRTLGFSPENVTSLDVSPYEGADVVHDLNVRVPEDLRGQFDIIFDGGTLEHVFSIAQALGNLAQMCRIGGTVVHMNPADYLNHGFVNFNATCFRDFYTANGFGIQNMKYIAMPNRPPHSRRYYREYAPEALQAVLRPTYSLMVYGEFLKKETRELVPPQQGYYESVWQAQPPIAPSPRSAISRAARGAAKRVPGALLAQSLLAMRRGRKIAL